MVVEQQLEVALQGAQKRLAPVRGVRAHALDEQQRRTGAAALVLQFAAGDRHSWHPPNGNGSPARLDRARRDRERLRTCAPCRGCSCVALAGLAGSAPRSACGEEKASTKPVATLKGDGFTVEMPGNPKPETINAQTAGGPVPITAYITEGGSEGFSMSVLKIPKGVRGDLDGAVKGAASSVGGTLKDTQEARRSRAFRRATRGSPAPRTQTATRARSSPA